MEILREIAPRTVRIGVIYDPASAGPRHLPELERALSPGMQSAPYAVRSRTELEEAIERIGGEPNGALIVLAGPLTAIHRDLIIISAVRHRLPLVYPYRYFTAAGGLISYGPDTVDQYRLAASYVDRILKGEKPADLPVQFPTKYNLVINLKTANALGLDVPPIAAGPRRRGDRVKRREFNHPYRWRGSGMAARRARAAAVNASDRVPQSRIA